MLTLAALALVLSLQASAEPVPERRYTDEFRRGVTALAAGEHSTAVAAFRAAGALAPEAPLWRLYLATAEGRKVAPPELAPSDAGPWRLVDDLEQRGPRFSPDGDTIVTGWSDACIFDGLSGERISQISHSREVWAFERSGRFFFGLRFAPQGKEQLEAIEVRRLATGEPACPPLLIGKRVSGGTSLGWSDEPFDAARAVEDGPWFFVRRAALDGGTLTAHVPRHVDVPNGQAWVELRRDTRRALAKDVRSRIGAREARTALIDPEESAPLLTLSAEWAVSSFSSDGSLVLWDAWAGPLQVYDAESGTALATPRPDAPADLSRAAQSITIVAQGGELLVSSHEELRTWDPRTGAWTATRPLAPHLADLPWALKVAPGLFVLERARALAFGNYWGLAVYDADSGERLWSRNTVGLRQWDGVTHESPTASRIILEGSDDLPLVLDARTGEPILALHTGSTATKSFELFGIDAGAAQVGTADTRSRDCALVAVADGSLRTFELATGHSLGRSELHRGRVIDGMDVGLPEKDAPASAAVTWDDHGRVVSWELPALVPRAQLDVEQGVRIRAASAATGNVLLTRTEVDGRTPVELRRIDGGALVASPSIGQYTAHAVSDDGHQVALVDAAEVHVLDSRTGALRVSFPLSAPPVGKHEGACAFHGPGHFALGWGNYDLESPGVGIDVYDLTTGKLAGRHRATGFSASLGGRVGDIESMPDVGRLAYSISYCSLLILLEDQTWTKVSELDFGGGNGSVLELSRAAGSSRLSISGVSSRYARLVATDTLEPRAKDAVAGLFDLCESPSGRYVAGLDAGRLQILEGARLAHLYERQELTGPGARLVRADKQLVDLGVGPTAQDCHIERNGSSHPLRCFEAWLLDPHGLGSVTLEHLPQPPSIDSGPTRRVRATTTSVALHFSAQDELGLVGAWVLTEGSAPRFLTTDEVESDKLSSVKFMAEIEGPWPVDIELVAVGRTGLESKPWRVRIEAEG